MVSKRQKVEMITLSKRNKCAYLQYMRDISDESRGRPLYMNSIWEGKKKGNKIENVKLQEN